MASSYCWKLHALIKKNLILMKRNLLRTIFEIFFPILMFLIMVELRKTFKIETHTFEVAEKNMSNFISNHSILTSLDGDKGIEFTNLDNESLDNLRDYIYNNIDVKDIDFDKIDFKNFNFSKYNISKYILDYINNDPDFKNVDITYLGINIRIPPYLICSNMNKQQQERPKIASIGIPDQIKFRMYIDAEIYNTLSAMKNQQYSFIINNNTFREFKSIEEMEKLIKSEEYLKDKNNLICFGLKFSYNRRKKLYNYSLHFFDYDKYGEGGIDDIPGKGIFDKYQYGPDIINYMKYQKGGYNYMMKVVNEYILKKVTNNINATFSFGIFPMKYSDYKVDDFGKYIGYIFTIIIIIAYMCPLGLYVYRFVEEKETRIKEGMKIMGLEESDYFLSYFIQYIIISFFVSLINSFLLSITFKIISWGYLFFFIFLFSLNIFSLIYFFQSFIDKTKICIVLSLIIYFIMYCISLTCMDSEIPFLTKGLLSIFPTVCLNLGVLEFNKFSYHFRQFYFRDLFIQTNNFYFYFMYLMFIFDFFFYLFLGYYLENVIPHDFGIKKSWYFLCTKSYWSNKKKKKIITIEDKKEELSDSKSSELFSEIDSSFQKNIISQHKDSIIQLKRSSTKFESEEIYEVKNINEIFKIRDLVKKFPDGKVAVKGVSLNFYKDEIFALLGHNGAGKTTFISILTGMYEATKGKAIYEGENVLDSDNMDSFRKKLGICPQHDILFEDLTIREHLEIFSIFKGVKSNQVKDEVDKILNDFQMMNIQGNLARNLSAGERRKLSIAISLIGGSEIIFLDEPSSGMDISSRRNLWEILKRQCEGKIIILTTHYMEVASVLGKRIGIINEGTMKCIGSPLFLIEKYGKYMSLNVTKEEDADDIEIVNFVTSLSNGIQYEILSEEIMFRIPIKEEKDNNKKVKIDIPKFFQEFDNNLNNLRIKSYSVSMPTLEDVFLNVAAEDNHKQNKQELIFDNLLYNTDIIENYTGKEKFKNDFLICMKRRYLITIRDIKGLILEVLCPIFLILFGLLITKINTNYKPERKQIDVNLTGKQIILFSSLNKKGYKNYFENSENVNFQEINNLGDETNNNRRNATLKFIEKIYDINYPFESNENQIVDTTKEDYVGYYSSMLLFSDNNNRYEFIMVLNSRVKHAIPIYCHYFLSSIIQKEGLKRKKKVNISYTHYPMPLTYDVKEQRTFGNNITIIFFIAIAFAIMPVNFISLLVKERINNSKHLMRISGINIFSYWLVNYIFEFIKYYFTAGICLILIKMFNFYRPYLYIFYIIYGPAMISFTYALSFIFSNEFNAQNTIILINFIFGDLSSVIILMLRG